MSIYPNRTRAASNRLGNSVVGDRLLATERITRVFGSRRRWALLRVLVEDDGGAIPVSTLVARLADTEYDVTLPTTLLDLRQRIHVALVRTHLPLLESCGLAVYDRERGVVLAGRELATVEPILDSDETASSDDADNTDSSIKNDAEQN